MTVSLTERSKPSADFIVLIKISKYNHKDAHLKNGAQLDAQILRFLVLLNMWLQTRGDILQVFQPQIAMEMQRNFRRDQCVNQFFRYFWLSKRKHKSFEDAMQSTNVRVRNPQLCLADHLLPQFMHLSCRVQPPDSNLETKWMELASNFMVQAAIEILDAPDVFEDGLEVAQIALEECFAWGYVERPRFDDNSEIVQRLLKQIESKSLQPQITQQSLDQCREHVQSTSALEDEVREMFYDEGSAQTRSMSGGPTTPQSSGELSNWTRIRQTNLDILLTTFVSIQKESGSDQHRPVEWLRKRYRLSSLLTEVADYIEVHWKNIHKNENRKPALVQIEEGGLDGLSPEAFSAFKRRAGIEDEWWLNRDG